VHRGQLFRKYFLLILALVCGALIISGGISLYFSYEENKEALASLQREKAAGAAARIEQFVKEIENQVAWTTLLSQTGEGADALEPRKFDFVRLGKLVHDTGDDPQQWFELVLWPVDGTLHRAYQQNVITLEEVDARVSEVLARMNGRGLVVSRPQIIRSGQEMALTIAEPVLGGTNNQDVVAAVGAISTSSQLANAFTVRTMISGDASVRARSWTSVAGAASSAASSASPQTSTMTMSSSLRLTASSPSCFGASVSSQSTTEPRNLSTSRWS